MSLAPSFLSISFFAFRLPLFFVSAVLLSYCPTHLCFVHNHGQPLPLPTVRMWLLVWYLSHHICRISHRYGDPRFLPWKKKKENAVVFLLFLCAPGSWKLGWFCPHFSFHEWKSCDILAPPPFLLLFVDKKKQQQKNNHNFRTVVQFNLESCHADFTGKLSVMIAILLYVFGSCQCHSKFTILHPFEAGTKRRLFDLDVSIKWAASGNWQTKLLGTWKVAHLKLLHLVRLSYFSTVHYAI